MYNRQQTYTLVKEDGNTQNYDMAAQSAGFDGTGVHFQIHVIHQETVTVTKTSKGQDNKVEKTTETRTFVKPTLLAAEASAENLMGANPAGHPDQLYLAKVPEATLTALKSKPILRVEIDDSIELCDSAPFGSCSQVIPAWCKKNFGDAIPVLIFVHRSDRHAVEKKFAYDLREGREDYNEQWQWNDAAPSASLAHNPKPAPAITYVMEFRCDSPKCGKKKNRPNVLAIVPGPAKPSKGDLTAAKGRLPTTCCGNPEWSLVNDLPRVKKAHEAAV